MQYRSARHQRNSPDVRRGRCGPARPAEGFFLPGRWVFSSTQTRSSQQPSGASDGSAVRGRPGGGAANAAPDQSSREQNNQREREKLFYLNGGDCPLWTGQAAVAAAAAQTLTGISCISPLHTLTVKMYFRETCKFSCTVLIICSILSCRNHCDMSSIK